MIYFEIYGNVSSRLPISCRLLVQLPIQYTVDFIETRWNSSYYGKNTRKVSFVFDTKRFFPINPWLIYFTFYYAIFYYFISLSHLGIFFGRSSVLWTIKLLGFGVVLCPTYRPIPFKIHWQAANKLHYFNFRIFNANRKFSTRWLLTPRPFDRNHVKWKRKAETNSKQTFSQIHVIINKKKYYMGKHPST